MGNPCSDFCPLLQVFIRIFRLSFSPHFKVTHSFFVRFSFHLNANHNAIGAHTFTHTMFSNSVTPTFQIQVNIPVMSQAV